MTYPVAFNTHGVTAQLPLTEVKLWQGGGGEGRQFVTSSLFCLNKEIS